MAGSHMSSYHSICIEERANGLEGTASSVQYMETIKEMPSSGEGKGMVRKDSLEKQSTELKFEELSKFARWKRQRKAL